MSAEKNGIMGKIVILSLLGTASVLAMGSSSYMRKLKRKKALRRAPIMQNPARTGQADPGAVGGRYDTKVALVSYSRERGACFRIRSSWSRSQLENMRFQLRAYAHIDQKLSEAPTVTASGIAVLRSRTRLVPYNTTVRDTVRDSRGRIIATRDRSVQRIRRQHNTLARVCFPAGQVPQKASRFLEMVGRVGHKKLWATWRLR